LLPFLKRTKEGSASMPVDHIKRDADEDKEPNMDSMEVCAQELCDAVHAKDVKAIAAALRAAFELCDLEPHEEGPHTNEEE
jgi:hypothetical protein